MPSIVTDVRATAWHNGTPFTDPAGYGIKFTKADRDRSFDTGWDHVVLELEGGDPVTLRLSPSFWRNCSELRSAAIGRWLLEKEAAPWPRSRPPGIAVVHIADNRFAARVLKRYNLL